MPEVKVFLSTTPASSKPDVVLAGEPGQDTQYYWIKVGISNNDIFRTSFDLYIEPETSQIFYWDQLCTSEGRYLITLQQWRYWRTKPEWIKSHIYKNRKLIAVKT
ncbi:hypothetical protein [Mucilaginibacter myungsuensis]|uniref:Uncharacterized protein n=1 Tax=Mucilaginibacter myungsuensis TaxID=649104 RepID=A0A929L128_9SPHI|nr:hypothetical protein [Mucilaginibacter myungsuensis]MBE9664183.1 hypothetical protein [Mucilaginibacter myungsuensis]MDN3599886.1 hypothetical protein [Mucilaginibacter myungsuensis]